jgi:hypothetical protein
MNVSLTGSGVASIVVLGAVAAVGAYLYIQREKLAQAVNPLSDKNVAYRSVNAVGERLTGDSEFTLGGWIYDMTHDTSWITRSSVEEKRAPGIVDQIYDYDAPMLYP